MGIVIGFLTFILVLNCLFLMLLILIQLPKKEAGVGMAFGGSAADALFGAGSGNALTKVTKYSAGAFLGMAVVLATLNSYVNGAHQKELRLERLVDQVKSTPSASPAASAPTTSPAPATAPASAAASTNFVSGPSASAPAGSNALGGFIAVPVPQPATPP